MGAYPFLRWSRYSVWNWEERADRARAMPPGCPLEIRSQNTRVRSSSTARPPKFTAENHSKNRPGWAPGLRR